MNPKSDYIQYYHFWGWFAITGGLVCFALDILFDVHISTGDIFARCIGYVAAIAVGFLFLRRSQHAAFMTIQQRAMRFAPYNAYLHWHWNRTDLGKEYWEVRLLNDDAAISIYEWKCSVHDVGKVIPQAWHDTIQAVGVWFKPGNGEPGIIRMGPYDMIVERCSVL